MLPPPSLHELQALKHALSESVSQQDHANNSPALRTPTPRERRALPRFSPLADSALRPSPPSTAAPACHAPVGGGSGTGGGKSSQRLRSLVAEASGAASAGNANGGALHEPL